MKRNLGTPDRSARVLLGLALIGFGWLAGSSWGLLGLIPLVTGPAGFCPACCPLKLDTRGRRSCCG
jgi:hypothetical protein